MLKHIYKKEKSYDLTHNTLITLYPNINKIVVSLKKMDANPIIKNVLDKKKADYFTKT